MLNLAVSSCLLGFKVRYDSKIKKCDDPLFDKISKNFNIFPICPEVDGGLPTPRPPSEIVSRDPLKIVNKIGEDVTSYFINGAKIALDICIENNIKVAILKSKSPSCSNNFVYDGTFSANLVEGKGVTVELLERHGIKVFNETELREFLDYVNERFNA